MLQQKDVSRAEMQFRSYYIISRVKYRRFSGKALPYLHQWKQCHCGIAWPDHDWPQKSNWMISDSQGTIAIDIYVQNGPENMCRAAFLWFFECPFVTRTWPWPSQVWTSCSCSTFSRRITELWVILSSLRLVWLTPVPKNGKTVFLPLTWPWSDTWPWS